MKSLLEDAAVVEWIESDSMMSVGANDFLIYIYLKDMVHFYNKKTNRLVLKNKLHGHTRIVTSLKYSSKYKYIFSAAMDNRLLVWNPYVKYPIISITSMFFSSVTPDIGGILKSVYYPSHSPMLAILTTSNTVAFFDMNTTAKIEAKKFPSNTPAFLLPSYPFVLLMGSYMEAQEFRENNVVSIISVTAVALSPKNQEVFIGMQNKLAVLALDNYSLIRQKTYDHFKQILRIELNHNHKYLLLVGSNMQAL